MPSGRAATVEQGSPAHQAEMIAALVLTRSGERLLVPGFGTPDPTYTGFEIGPLILAASIYGPPVTISLASADFSDPHTQDVKIEFG